MARRIGFIGCGQMATALASGFAEAGLVAGAEVCGYDPDARAADRFAAASGGSAVADPAELTQCCDVLWLAVKPQVVPKIAAVTEFRHFSGHVVSIVAGTTLERLREIFVNAHALVRVMPNTPCLIGVGACGVAGEADTPTGVIDQTLRLLRGVGVAEAVGEPLLDAVTGLSGSGPAFVYLMIEALADAGVHEGLSRAVALKLATQTVAGTARMVQECGDHPAVLRDRVTSPAGTTAAGLASLERAGVRGAVLDAVVAASRRARELGGDG